MPDENNPHSAREAAEALFKPQKQKPATKPDDTPAETVASVEHQPVHEPQILPIQQPQPESEPAQPTESKSGKKRGRPPSLNGGQIKKAEFGRIRTLVNYWMIVAQVAEVYGVGESEIERVVAANG